MRICYWGTYDATYVRNRVMLAGLRLAGAEVCECHADLWHTPHERVAETARRGINLHLLMRWIGVYLRLSARLLAMRRPDIVIVGYPGQIDVLVARMLCWLRRVPLVFDAFLSLYETAVTDRALVAPGSLKARALWRLERLGCRLADLVLLDTEADCQYFGSTYDVGRYARVWVGAEEPPPTATNLPRETPSGVFDVLFVGTFIPLHGIEHVLHAAALLQDTAPEVRLTLIGNGQTYAAMKRLAEELALRNVIWGPEWLDTAALAERSARADLMLGVFGTSAKAQRVIPAKAYAALALGRPLLTADTPGVREALLPGETAFLCPPGDAVALAAAIQAAQATPEIAARISAQGQALYRQQFTPQAIGALALGLIQPLLQRRKQS